MCAKINVITYNILYIIYNCISDDELNTIVLGVKEGREFLWNKLREAFKYVYNNYIDEYDWFLRADDDTYVILENLRYMLYPYSKDMPIHFGYKFKPYTKQV